MITTAHDRHHRPKPSLARPEVLTLCTPGRLHVRAQSYPNVAIAQPALGRDSTR